MNVRMELGKPGEVTIPRLKKSQCSISARRDGNKGKGREVRATLEIARLISLVKSRAAGTAKAIEMHLPASFCKVTSSTAFWLSISRTKRRNFSFLCGSKVKACLRESEVKPK